MGHVFDFKTSKAYEKWCSRPDRQEAANRETGLMLALLTPMRGRRVLDIGCGHGTALSALLNAGLDVTGLDPSPYMLDMARHHMGHRVEYRRGIAEDLPFEDNAFHYACLSKTLEFVENPEKALEEAFRVTRERVFLGIVNRRALKVARAHCRDIPISFCDHASVLGLRKVKRMIRRLAGNVPVTCRALWHPPCPLGRVPEKLMLMPLAHRMPVSMYIGIVITLNPRWTTRPLRVSIPAKQGRHAPAG